MKAWRLEHVGEPLVLRTVPDPTPAAGEVVVDVKAVGLCHSDVSFVDGTIAYALARLPLTLGHETAGVVAAVGDQVTRFAVGDRVGVRAGVQGPGVAFDGGFAEHVAVAEGFVARLPENLSFEQAAVATDAGKSSRHAIVCCGQVTAGTRMGLVGLGGLGSLGLQIAVAHEAKVYVAEVDESKHDRAGELGAAGVTRDISAFADRNLDVIVDFAGFGTTTAAAVDVVRPHGRVVQVGLARAAGTINLARLTLSSISLIGSSNGGHEDLEQVLRLMANGTVRSAVEHIEFAEIGHGLDRLARGDVHSRLVALLDR